MAGQTRISRRRQKYLQAIDEIERLASDFFGLAGSESIWSGKQWRLNSAAELLVVGLYTEWECFSHDLFILLFSEDISKFAGGLDFSIQPRRVSAGMAEIMLTGAHYLDFRNAGELKEKAEKWLRRNPFKRMTPAQTEAINDLAVLRNRVVHRNRRTQREFSRRILSRSPRGIPPVPGAVLTHGSPPTLFRYISELKAAGNIV